MKASSRTVKSFLLDQTVLAGLGNIYVDEALFLAGIRPSRRCNHIGKERTQRLAKSIHTVLAEGIEYGGTTIRDFVNGSGREGEIRKIWPFTAVRERRAKRAEPLLNT